MKNRSVSFLSARLERIYEARFIYDSYACQRKKGTHRAILRAQRYLRRHAFYLQTDIVRFFPNVDHEVLMSVIRRRINDRRLLELIELIIASGEGVLSEEATGTFFAGDDFFAVLRPKGLPIGNLTSQFDGCEIESANSPLEMALAARCAKTKRPASLDRRHAGARPVRQFASGPSRRAAAPAVR